MQKMWVQPRVGKIPWRRKWQPIPVFLPEKFYGQRSLAGYSPWGLKESVSTERLSTHACTVFSKLHKMYSALYSKLGFVLDDLAQLWVNVF